MAIASARTITVTYSGDQTYSIAPAAAANAASPGVQELKTFTGAGDNTVTVPTGGSTPTAVTIVPPAGNTQAITLKGAGGDTGVALHKTDPTSLGIGAAVTSFILNVAGTVTGIRFIWS